MNKLLFKLVFSMVLSGLLISCEKAIIVPADSIIGQDISLSQKNSNMLQDIVNQVIESQNISTLKTSEGSLISAAKIEVKEINADQINYNIHFDGTEIGPNKVIITGDMLVVVNGKKLNEDGMKASVVTSNLTINGVRIQDDLKMNILNISTIRSYQETWTFTQDFTMIYSDGSTMVVRGTGKRFQTAGYTTESFADDSYKIDVEINGTATNAIKFSGKTIAPLIKLAGCKNFAGGTLNWVSQTGSRFIDYGNGYVCDATAIVNIGGREVKSMQQ